MKSAKEEKKKKEEKKVKDPLEKPPEKPESVTPPDTEKTGDKDDIDTLKERIASEKDRCLRLSAEFDNYKKRKQRELDEFKKFANESVFRQILPVVDNLERAIAAAEKDTDQGGLLEGVRLTYKEILRLLEMFGVKVVKADQEPFDPNFHQAVTRQDNSDFPDNTVLMVLQNGYLLHDRLIRPAMVVVSKRIEQENEKKSEN